jgi:hypothetical protein
LYAKVDEGNGISFADVQRFNDLQRFQSRVMAQVTLLGKKNLDTIQNLLEESYDLSYSYMSYAVEKEAGYTIGDASPDLPALLEKVWENPIYGLKLHPSMESNRAQIVRNLNEAIESGLKGGTTYGGIANNIRVVFESSLRRSMTIARTETHRVREQASQDSSMNAHSQGIKMIKIWRNLDDERVRETKQANHVKMEGQSVYVDEEFIMVGHPENRGMTPGNINGPKSGSFNINCRCYSSRRISKLETQLPETMVKGTFEDWQKAKKG